MPMKVVPVRTLAIRELYTDVKTGDIYRVVHTGCGQAKTFLCKILGEKLVIREHDTQEFLSLSDQAQGDHIYERFEGEDPFVANNLASQTPAGERNSSKNWSLVQGLVFDTDGQFRTHKLLSRAYRRTALLEHAKREDCGVSLLYKLLRRYLQRGLTEAAISSQYPNCGAKRTNVLHCAKVGGTGVITSEQTGRKFKKRPGRPREPDDLGFQYAKPDEVLEKLFWQAADIYFTWKSGAWVIPPEAVELKRKFKKRRRGTDGVLKISPKAAVAPLSSGDKRKKRKRGSRSKPTQLDMVSFISYQLRRRREVRDGEGRIIELEFSSDKVVTPRQFQWFLYRTQPNFIQRRNRHPSESPVRRFEQLPGRAAQHVLGPGQCGIIDSTVLDIYIVSPQNRTIVLGRPCLYFVIDVWSGMVLGMYLGIEHPSREAAALALVNTVTNKRELCAEFGLEIKESDWPCRYLPDNFLMDRASDFRCSEPWRTVAQMFQTSFSNTPPITPTWRSIGERRFGSIPRLYQRAAFGTVERDFGTRTAPNYPWDACYTLAEVTLMLLRAIHRYHRTPIEGGQPPPMDMVYANKADTPLNRWEWGIENGTGCLRAVTPEEVRLATWPTDKARLFPSGVLWKGVWYHSPTLREEFWASRPKKGKDRSQTVEIRYDPSDLAEIRFTVYGRHEVCSFDQRRNRHDLRGVTLAEWNEWRKRDRKNRRDCVIASQSDVFIQLNNTQIESELAEKEQADQLKREGRKHPDATNMQGARRMQKRKDALGKGLTKKASAASPGNDETSSDVAVHEAEVASSIDAEIEAMTSDAMYSAD